jgi:hypothetical protein
MICGDQIGGIFKSVERYPTIINEEVTQYNNAPSKLSNISNNLLLGFIKTPINPNNP